MVVPFGVSLSDFFAAFKLSKTIVRALIDIYGSSAQYQALLSRLDDLEESLEPYKVLGVVDNRTHLTLKRITKNIEDSIESFRKTLSRYHPALAKDGSGNKFKAAFRRVQFAFIKDDILRFQSDLQTHFQSLHVLLADVTTVATLEAIQTFTEQVKEEFIEVKKLVADVKQQAEQTHASQLRLRQYLTACVAEICDILKNVFNGVRLIQALLGSLPPQVHFDKPLIFQDAFGKFSPLHREWVQGWEDLYQVLCIKFRDKPGERAVIARNYKLQDGSMAGKWSDVDTDQPFETIFQPEGRWDQAMVFPRDPEMGLRCPRCNLEEQHDVDPSRIVCTAPQCHLIYSRSSDCSTGLTRMPPHFEIHRHPVAEEAEEADAANPDKFAQDVVHAILDEDLEDMVEGLDADLPDGNNEEHPLVDATIQIEDFSNVYLARSPPVWLKDLNETWLVIPWPFFYSPDKFSRIVSLFGLAATPSDFILRNWQSGVEINEANWSDEAEMGMFVEMAIRDRDDIRPASRDQDAPVVAGSDTSASPALCWFCSRWFCNDTALGNHCRETHLSNGVCGFECENCYGE